jgi:predicted transcriptional regulator
MGRRIGVTASEMLTMREEGMSNHDIAKALDISVPTVLRYIGKQG